MNWGSVSTHKTITPIKVVHMLITSQSFLLTHTKNEIYVLSNNIHRYYIYPKHQFSIHRGKKSFN